MAWGARIAMRIDPVLTLSQWLSPNFPIGAFAYSSGLEAAIADGWVTPDTLRDWLTDMLEHGSGRSDAILIRAAATGDPKEVDDIGRAFTPAFERLTEVDAMGAAFCAQMRSNWDMDLDDMIVPAAFGAAVGRLGLPLDLAVQMYLQGWVSNLVAAGQRLMPLGQTQAQGIVAALGPLCQHIAADTADSTLDNLTSQSFLADIAAMRHETLSPRIFRT